MLIDFVLVITLCFVDVVLGVLGCGFWVFLGVFKVLNLGGFRGFN